jgi:hypothetical protein
LFWVLSEGPEKEIDPGEKNFYMMLLKPISHSDDAFGFFPSTYLKYLLKI